MIRKFSIKQLSFAIVLVMVGLLAGYVLFSNGHDPETTKTIAYEDEHDHGDENEIAYWTCSMHPQIREDGPGACPICGMDLIPAYREEREVGDYSMTMTEAAMNLARIRTIPVEKRVPEKQIRLPGRIKVDERRTTNVTAHFPGRIRNLHVDFTGAPIRKGEPMATIYAPELISAQRELLQALRRAERQPGLAESAREKLRRWELSERQIREIEEKGEVRTDLDILSPVDGFVLSRNIAREQHVVEGSILFEVADLSYVWAVFEAYAEDIEWISPGDAVTFRMRSRPGEIKKATVDYIDPAMKPDSRTIGVRADIENAENTLKPEMLVSGEISSKLAEEALMVPATAVLWTGPRSIVYVKDADAEQPFFEVREVTLGPRSGDFYVIKDGLEEGEDVVYHGTFRVDSEFQLADRFSMMNRQPGEGVVPVHDHGHEPAEDHDAHDHEGTDMDEPAPDDLQDAVDADFREEFTSLIHEYLRLHEALFDSDPQRGAAAGEAFMQTLTDIGAHRLTGDAHMAWMAFYNDLESHGAPIGNRDDLETMRHDFRMVSDVLIDAVLSLGAGIDLYKQYCPMAFDSEGAYWLNDVPEIQNPYLSEAMPGCGEVTEELDAAASAQSGHLAENAM